MNAHISTPQRLKNIQLILIVSSIFCLSGCQENFTSAGEILLNIQKSSSAIMNLIISFTYLCGAALMVKGIFALKVYGEQRTMMSPQTTIRIPMTYLGVGTGLLFFPQMLHIVNESIFAQPTISLLTYSGEALSPTNLLRAALSLVQVVGLIAVVRAFFILSNPHQQGGQGGIGKAMAHFLGGLAALNVTYTLSILGIDIAIN